ncbi:hypothetical protein BT96DRAFT_998768 [Gymnopus androsaceus JB14]|uniref:Uncharacterized protein n=1 Tax=Gymnopus androsaceus JB14 TaxID=1447944 RepID=A0A6A4H8V3_9AGAR|nr:hypothetical protein BT96DRAFT_998768 [Gymnopus androsaceus JB14]
MKVNAKSTGTSTPISAPTLDNNPESEIVPDSADNNSVSQITSNTSNPSDPLDPTNKHDGSNENTNISALAAGPEMKKRRGPKSAWSQAEEIYLPSKVTEYNKIAGKKDGFWLKFWPEWFQKFPVQRSGEWRKRRRENVGKGLEEGMYPIFYKLTSLLFQKFPETCWIFHEQEISCGYGFTESISSCYETHGKQLAHISQRARDTFKREGGNDSRKFLAFEVRFAKDKLETSLPEVKEAIVKEREEEYQRKLKERKDEQEEAEAQGDLAVEDVNFACQKFAGAAEPLALKLSKLMRAKVAIVAYEVEYNPDNGELSVFFDSVVVGEVEGKKPDKYDPVGFKEVFGKHLIKFAQAGYKEAKGKTLEGLLTIEEPNEGEDFSDEMLVDKPDNAPMNESVAQKGNHV